MCVHVIPRSRLHQTRLVQEWAVTVCDYMHVISESICTRLDRYSTVTVCVHVIPELVYTRLD